MTDNQELEQNLLSKVAKKIGTNNQTIEEVIKKIMSSVDIWFKEHKKDLIDLDEQTLQEYKKPTFLMRKLIEIKYAKTKLTQAVYHNLKRSAGNLSEEKRMLALYDTFEKFDYKCPYSDTLLLGGKQSIHLEHIIPVAMGGSTDDWNCIPICGTCNSSKNDKHLLDWWKDNRTIEEEYKLVKIFEFMTEKLLDKTNTIKYEKNEENPTHLDAITFLNQLLNHIEENKQYIFKKEFENNKEKQIAINKKIKELNSTFEKVVKKNNRNTKTDKQFFAEQKEMVKYVKNLGVGSYYKVAYTCFDTIQEMRKLGKSETEIRDFCISQDDWFTPFFEKLVEYKNKEIINKNGKIKKPKGSFYAVSSDKEIGGKVDSIRLAKKGKSKTKLTKEMIEKLDSIGFPWEADTDWFTPFFEKLVEYKNNEIVGKNGKIKKPKGSFAGVTYNDEIGNTVRNIRLAKKGNGGTKLTQEMIEKLDSISFPWEVNNDWFSPFFEKLILYKNKVIVDKNGRIIKSKGSFDGVTNNNEIGYTVGRIRSAKKGNGSTKLTPEMIEKLDSIDFPWEADDWYTPFFEKLVEYKNKEIIDENGKIKKPKGSFESVTKNEEIGNTVASIRRAKKGKGGTKLTPEMIKMLDSIGFPWEADTDWFTPFFEKLVEYKNKEILGKNGKIKKPKGSFASVIQNEEIGRTVKCIRQAKKGKGSTKLTQEMIEKLDSISFPWEAKSSKNQQGNLSV